MPAAVAGGEEGEADAAAPEQSVPHGVELASLELNHPPDAVAHAGAPFVDAAAGRLCVPLAVAVYTLDAAPGPGGRPVRRGGLQSVTASISAPSPSASGSASPADAAAALRAQPLADPAGPAALDVAAWPRFPSAADAAPPLLVAACAENALLSSTAAATSTSASTAAAALTPLTPLQPRDPAGPDVLVLSACLSRTALATSDSRGALALRPRAADGSFCPGPPTVRAGVHAAEAWSVAMADADVVRGYYAASAAAGSDSDDGGGRGGADGTMAAVELARLVLLSGGDDGALVVTDMRAPRPALRVRNAHGGVGVTCVTVRSPPAPASSPSPTACPLAPPDPDTDSGTSTVWTGGFDDTLRVWDLRMPRRERHEVHIGGGVWRIRFHPSRPRLALVAAIYAGCRVVAADSRGDVDPPRVVAQYSGHESIAYGAEWAPALESGPLADHAVAVTASFYDRKVKLWAVESSLCV